MNLPEISELQVIPVKPKEGLIAFASFVLDQKYYISSVAIYSRLDGAGFRLVYPSKKVGDRQMNIFHPITSEVGAKIEEAVNEKVSKLFDDSYDNRTTK